MNKKVLIFGGVIVAAALGFYLYTKNKANGGNSEGELKSGDVSGSSSDSSSSSNATEIRSDLKWVANKNIAAYLATVLNTGKGVNLRNWINLIKKERAADSSKWKDSEGLTGQVSDIAHALYQMSEQNTHGVTWSHELKYGLMDNQ